MTVKFHRKPVRVIVPDHFYPWEVFQHDSGCGPNKIREGKRYGIELKFHKIGQRQYVEGKDGIAFLKALAAKHAELESAK